MWVLPPPFAPITKHIVKTKRPTSNGGLDFGHVANNEASNLGRFGPLASDRNSGGLRFAWFASPRRELGPGVFQHASGSPAKPRPRYRPRPMALPRCAPLYMRRGVDRPRHRVHGERRDRPMSAAFFEKPKPPST
jgi:hypothetical protein